MSRLSLFDMRRKRAGEIPNPDQYFRAGSAVVQDEVTNRVTGANAVNEGSLLNALKALRLAAELYETEKRWNDAIDAWSWIEAGVSDKATKSDAKANKERCIDELNHSLNGKVGLC